MIAQSAKRGKREGFGWHASCNAPFVQHSVRESRAANELPRVRCPFTPVVGGLVQHNMSSM
jgi:hypothetical protein